MSDRDPTSFPAIDPAQVPARRGAPNYPEMFRAAVAGREKRALGDALGLSGFGVNLVRLDPGAASALRHWHSLEDEFVMVLSGAIVLVTDSGERVLGPGMAAGFPAGKADAHRLLNRGTTEAVYIEVGGRCPGDRVTYPDDDVAAAERDGRRVFTRKDGRPY